MSEEEKEVLKTLKNGFGLTSAEQEILSNYIDKLQKENEELKEEIKNKDIEIATLLEEDNCNKEQVYKIKDIVEELLEE